MATLGDVLREIFQAQAPMPNDVDNINRPASLQYGANAGRVMNSPSGPPVPTEAESMPYKNPGPLVSEPETSTLIDKFKAILGGNGPLEMGIFGKGQPPQPPDGMDKSTYQVYDSPKEKPPAWIDRMFGGPPEAIPSASAPPSPRPAPPPNLSPSIMEAARVAVRNPGAMPPADTGTVDVRPRREAGVTYGDARVPPGMMPRGPGADVPDLFPPGRSPRGPAPAPAPAADGPNEMARMFRNFFQGAAAVNPTSPKFSAFSQGAAGSMTANYQEKQAEEQRKAQRERQGFEDSLKIGKARREDAAVGSLIEYRKKKVGSPGETPYSAINHLTVREQSIHDSYRKDAKGIRDNYELNPEQKKAALEELAARRDSELARVRKMYTDRTLNPDMPEKKSGAEKPAGLPDIGKTYTRKDGSVWKRTGEDPNDERSWERVR